MMTLIRVTSLFIAISLSACQTITGPSAELQKEIDLYLMDKDKNFTDTYKTLFIEGERNAVLNFNRLGWLNLVYGDFDEASWAFDQSLNRIETIYADNKEAMKAKSNFSKEDVKDFKGEPYERAMAYYYRGILFLIEGDYENARATFKMGEFQDTLSEKEIFQSDFALLNFLQGWASFCNGDYGLADEAFTYAAEYNPKLLYPNEEHKLLLLFEAGNGPFKIAAGEYKEILQFQQGVADLEINPEFFLQYYQEKVTPIVFEPALTEQSTAQVLSVPQEISVETNAKQELSVAVDVAGVDYIAEQTNMEHQSEIHDSQADQINIVLEKVVGSVNAAQAADIFFQANSRGGRPIQGILDGKAQFKDVTKMIGKVASTVGAVTTVGGLVGGSEIATAVGIGLQLGGAVASMISSATTAEADIRYWDTLPNLVYLATSKKPSSDFLVKVGNKGSTVVNTKLYGNIKGGDNNKHCSVFWATSKNPHTIPASSPKARLSWEEMSDKDDDIEFRDKQFRRALADHQAMIY